MRILHIITRLILGGAQQNTVMTCAAQHVGKHDVHLAYGPIYGPEGSLLEEALTTGAELHEVATLRRPLQPIGDVRCYRALRRLIRFVRPDVVHTHSSKAGIVGRGAAWAERVPAVVHTVHGLAFHDRQSRLVHQLYVAAERWAAKRCHRLIAISPQMVDAFEARRIAPRETFTVIPSAIDIDHFASTDIDRAEAKAAFGFDDSDIVIGLVARLDPLKGHHDVLDMLPTLVERHPEVKVLFVGDGFGREQVEQAIGASGHADRVHMLGLVSFEQMPRVYRAIDISVLPSYQEGQSRTLAESLLCGCAIAAYDTGGIGSICIDGETGRLVPTGDHQALADAITWLIEHGDKRVGMIERGRQLIEEKFDVRDMAAKIEQVYRDALDSNQHRKQ